MLRRAVVVVPLKAGVHEHVRRLVAGGPPFEPGHVGLERHHVFVTDGEVIFFFEGTAASLKRIFADPSVAVAAATWGEHVASAPRIAEDAYSWAGVEDGEGLSFEATPGPGDSEGGDLYPP